MPLSQTPQVGDSYTFVVTYADGTQYTQTSAVQGVITVAPTLTVTQPDSGGFSFTWNNISAQVPNAASYQLSVTDQYGNTIWQRQYPLNTLSGAFNDDGNAWEPLNSGDPYTCSIQINDQFGDFAYSSVTVTAITQTTVQVLADYTVPQQNPYSLMLQANGQQISMVTVSGPNVLQTTLTADTGWSGYTASVPLSQSPQVGDAYTFVVTYTDGTQYTQVGTVQGVVTVAPTLTVNQPSPGNLSFAWNDVSAQVANAAYYQLFVAGNGGNIWQNWYSLDTLSATFNDDGSAMQSLQSGQTYNCSLQILDDYGDCGQMNVSVTIEAN